MKKLINLVHIAYYSLVGLIILIMLGVVIAAFISGELHLIVITLFSSILLYFAIAPLLIDNLKLGHLLRESKKGTKPKLRPTLRSFMEKDFTEFEEIKLPQKGVLRNYLVYNNNKISKYILFQTDKWGNKFWLETGSSKIIQETPPEKLFSDIAFVTQESYPGQTQKRIGEYEYYSQEQLEKQIPKIKKAIEKIKK